MTIQSKHIKPRRPLVSAAVSAAPNRPARQAVALAWCDPETGERIRVEVAGSDELLERLLAAGFVVCDAEPEGEDRANARTARARAASGTPETPTIACDGNSTGVPRIGPSAGLTGGTPSSRAG